MNFKPMLAGTITEEQLNELRYPLIVQPKLDGIRCVILEGEVLSRTLKPIPNKNIAVDLINLWLSRDRPYLIDGELCKHGEPFQFTTSNVMTEDADNLVDYVTFDYAQTKNSLLLPYLARTDSYTRINIKSIIVDELEFLIHMEQRFVEDRYEGIIIRGIDSLHKNGRSTFKEQGLLKFKRFEDAEAVIIGFKEKLKNENDLEYDERGYAKHSSHKENMVKTNTLGALCVSGINGQFKDVEFDVGSGFTDIQRKHLWGVPMGILKDRIIIYKYQRVGSKDKPRCPIFKGFKENI